MILMVNFLLLRTNLFPRYHFMNKYKWIGILVRHLCLFVLYRKVFPKIMMQSIGDNAIV